MAGTVVTAGGCVGIGTTPEAHVIVISNEGGTGEIVMETSPGIRLPGGTRATDRRGSPVRRTGGAATGRTSGEASHLRTTCHLSCDPGSGGKSTSERTWSELTGEKTSSSSRNWVTERSLRPPSVPISSSDEDNPSRSKHGDPYPSRSISPLVSRRLAAGDAGESVDIAHGAWTCQGPSPNPAKRGSAKSISAWTVYASAGGRETMSEAHEAAPHTGLRDRRARETVRRATACREEASAEPSTESLPDDSDIRAVISWARRRWRQRIHSSSISFRKECNRRIYVPRKAPWVPLWLTIR